MVRPPVYGLEAEIDRKRAGHDHHDDEENGEDEDGAALVVARQTMVHGPALHHEIWTTAVDDSLSGVTSPRPGAGGTNGLSE